MMKRVYCGKKTKIYVPKTVSPGIITYKPYMKQESEIKENVVPKNYEESDINKRHY